MVELLEGQQQFLTQEDLASKVEKVYVHINQGIRHEAKVFGINTVN